MRRYRRPWWLKVARVPMLIIGGILSAVVLVIVLPLALIFGVLALTWILLTSWRNPSVDEDEEYGAAASRRKSGPATDHPVFGSMYETESGWIATVRCPLLAELRSGVDTTSASPLSSYGQGEGVGAEEVISTPFLKHSGDETFDDGEDPEAFDVFIVDEDGEGPSPEQERAFEFLKENAETVVHNAFRSIHQNYMDFVRCGHASLWPNPAFRAAVLPDNQTLRESPWLDSPEGITALIQYPGISIEPVYEDSEGDVADTRLSFHCDWDMEHGLAVLLNQDRVVAVGDATVDRADGVADSLGEDMEAAVAVYDVQRVRELLEDGADPNRQVKLPRGLALISESPARRRKREQTPLLYAERKLHQLESMNDAMKAKVGPAYPDFLEAYTAAAGLLRKAAS